MDVAINISNLQYPSSCPFNPDQIYPELKGLYDYTTDSNNKVYGAVRDLLVSLELDDNNIGKDTWNPFSDFIRQGDKVVIKPNLVLHHNRNKSDISAVVTHASLIRPLIDYTLLALKGTGEVIVGDAPHGDARFDVITKANGLYDLVEWYKSKGYNIKLIDFRKFVYPNGFKSSVFVEREGDPEGYVSVDLGEHSHLCELNNLEKLYGSDFDRSFIVRQHQEGHHKYLVSGTIMKADVVISVPKLKTHKKAGVTINMKNLVGINGDKNYLAHYRIGSPSHGGDEFPNSKNPLLLFYRWYERFSADHFLAKNKMFYRYLYRICGIPSFCCIALYCLFVGKDNVAICGAWYGNDTCWRMCLDLNYVLKYANKEGKICDTPQRRYFSLVDGIVAGEGNGPMKPDPRPIGALLAGKSPFHVDYVASYIMGFDPQKLSQIRTAAKENSIVENNLKVICKDHGVIRSYKDINFDFKEPPTWKGTMKR
jgi:uncharacterized protein (DUF362 family)